MPTKKNNIALTRSELEELLFHQKKVLTRSCVFYNKGEHLYSHEIAIKLVLLLHESTNNKSLLGQLLIPEILPEFPFVSSHSSFLESEIKTTYSVRSRLVSFEVNHNQENVGKRNIPIPMKPYGDSLKNGQITPFTKWWEKDVILISQNHKTFTRKDIVTVIRNKLGSHIDPFIPKNYSNLFNNSFKAISFELNTECGNSIHYEADTNLVINSIIRQIAFEVISTLELMVLPFLKDKKIPPENFEIRNFKISLN